MASMFSFIYINPTLDLALTVRVPMATINL